MVASSIVYTVDVTDISFVFTNPRHHVEMMLPVARALMSRGKKCQLISLAELRGLESPRELDVPVKRAIPLAVRKSPSAGSSEGATNAGGNRLRHLAQRAVSAMLVPRTMQLVGRSQVVVVPNDWVFPYDGLVKALRDRAAVVLMQEGIRLVTPNGDAYGTSGLAALCAWGEGSADFFRVRGVDPRVIRVTGTPRLDALDPSSWTARGAELLTKLGLRKPPIAFLSNPIEIQGYGTRHGKLELFQSMLEEAEPFLRERDLDVIVKNHLHEDPQEYARAAAKTRAADRVKVLTDVPLFSALAAAGAGIVLTSTVGLEALMFGKPIASLEIPSHGFGFEYVERGAAVGLRSGSIAAGLAEMLDHAATRKEIGDRFVERHVFQRGRATANVADVLTQLLA